MVDPLDFRSRSRHQLVWCVILTFVLSATAFGRTQQQVLLGTRTVLSSPDNNQSEMAEAFPVTANSSGQVNTLSVFLDSSNTAGTVWVGLYSNYYGHPSQLLSQAVIQQPVSGNWNSVAIPAVKVTQGRRYWVALLGVNGQIAFRDSSGNCYSETSQQTTLTSLPATWQTGSQWPTCILSVFGFASAGTVSVSVSPAATSLQTGQQKQFSSTVNGTTNTAVTWSSAGGTITSAGMYTAPSAAGTYTITATSAADSTKSASAVVTVAQAQQVAVSVSPGTASIQSGAQQQFIASVSGSTNTAVAWSASGGTITTSGLYVAPTAAGTYTVTATSAADSTKSASAVVTVAQSQQVAISVSPGTASIQSGAQQQFTASVSGSSNTAVTWSASGGTITTSGLYVAPSAAGTYTVTATSAADSTKSASAVVTVAQTVAISVSPGAASIQSGAQQQFTAFVSGTSNTAVTWSASGGTVNTSGMYVAPSTAGTYAVTATSVADPTKSSSASATVSASQNVSISISPTTVAMPEKWQQQFAATVSGSSNTAVTWAVTQGSGTITQSGLYTAPQAVETDVIAATSGADSTKSASASVTVAAPHSVSLQWSPSTSSNISYYNVYRGTANGGPYSLLKNSLSSTAYTDANVQSGSTYYYVTTAVSSSGMESGYSAPAQAVIPMP